MIPIFRDKWNLDDVIELLKLQSCKSKSNWIIRATVMQIEKAFWKFRIPTIHNFAVI